MAQRYVDALTAPACYLYRMQFTTPVEILSPEPRLSWRDRFFLSGSCFSDEIGGQMQRHFLQATVNPFGVVYNPVALAVQFERLAENRPPTGGELFEHDGLWHHRLFHGRFSAADREDALMGMTDAFVDARRDLSNTTVCIITLGTAWVFRHLESGEIVANNHKLPHRAFERRLLQPEDVLESLHRIRMALASLAPSARLFLTVSPVRHLKDGATGNNRSKAHLLTAVHRFLEEASGAYYFPAYEIMMDELRDYRFYKADMLHPNAQAVQYIWERFAQACFDDETREMLPELASLRSGMSHRPLHDGSAAHVAFVASLHKQFIRLKSGYSMLNFSEAEAFFSGQD